METKVQDAATERHARLMRRGALVEGAVDGLVALVGIAQLGMVLALTPEPVNVGGAAAISFSVCAALVAVSGCLAGIAGCVATWRRWSR